MRLDGHLMAVLAVGSSEVPAAWRQGRKRSKKSAEMNKPRHFAVKLGDETEIS
jgi:hypothetical protein